METFSIHARKDRKIHLMSIKEKAVLTKPEYFSWIYLFFFLNNYLVYVNVKPNIIVMGSLAQSESFS